MSHPELLPLPIRTALEREQPTFSETDAAIGRWNFIEERVQLGVGQPVFREATERLLTWRMHTGSGLRVRVSQLRVAEGVVMQARPFGLPRPLVTTRIVSVQQADRRVSFSYVTLAAHPLRGRETFTVEIDDDRVTLSVQAIARPAGRVLAAAGPLVPLTERLMMRVYGRALRA